MKPPHFHIATRLFLLSAGPAFAAAACAAHTNEPTGTTQSALGSCPPGQEQNDAGTCNPCTVSTTGTLTAANLTLLFERAGVGKACYTVTNNMGQFDLDGSACGNSSSTTSQLAQLITVPPPADVTPPTVQGSIPIHPVCINILGNNVCPTAYISYSAYPSIQSLTLAWDNWQVGPNTVEIKARLSAVINIHFSADPIVVNPTLTLTQLPVTITFGAGNGGIAPMSASQVVVGSPSSYGSVTNCGAFGWCNGLVLNNIGSSFQSGIQSTLATQFASALNGQNNSSPFWFGLMQVIAHFEAGVLTDPAANPLPSDGTSSAAGTPSWTESSFDGYARSQITAKFTTDNLCYLDCTASSIVGVCGANGCGTAFDDSCGYTVSCPGSCTAPLVCNNNNHLCVTACELTGAECGEAIDGSGATVSCGTCNTGQNCESGRCVDVGGTNGTTCTACRKAGGACGPNGFCVFSTTPTHLPPTKLN